MNIYTVIDEFKPAVAARYTDLVHRQFNRMTAMFGQSLRGIFNSESSRTYRSLVAPSVSHEGGINGVAFLDEERLAQNADKYATATVAEWARKIDAKLGDLLGNVHVVNLGHTTFRIVGERNGHHIEIEQTMILKASSRGKLHNQFPARIYVDGKFTSEAAYKRL